MCLPSVLCLLALSDVLSGLAGAHHIFITPLLSASATSPKPDSPKHHKPLSPQAPVALGRLSPPVHSFVSLSRIYRARALPFSNCPLCYCHIYYTQHCPLRGTVSKPSSTLPAPPAPGDVVVPLGDIFRSFPPFWLGLQIYSSPLASHPSRNFHLPPLVNR